MKAPPRVHAHMRVGAEEAARTGPHLLHVLFVHGVVRQSAHDAVEPRHLGWDRIGQNGAGWEGTEWDSGDGMWWDVVVFGGLSWDVL